MADWAILGGIGKGVTEGLDDKRKMDEAAQQKKLRQLQIDTAQDEQDFRKSVKGIRKVGSPTYDNSFQKQGAGPAQAKAMDAQTAEFGDEGAQLTANALAGAKGLQFAPPVKSIPYAASDQAGDIADLAIRSGRPEVAAQFRDSAFTLGQREVQERTNQFMRTLADPNVSLAQAAEQLAQLHTADKTPYAAFMNKGPANKSGLPEVTLFNAKTGEWTTHEVQSKAELAQFAQSLVDHNSRHQIMQEQIQQGQLGLQARTAGAAERQAGAAEKNAETAFQRYNAEKTAGLFTAQADHLKQQAEALKITAPAQAAYYRAHAAQANAIASEMGTKAKSWENKLGDNEKMLLGGLEKTALEMQKEAASNPTQQTQDAAQAAMFRFANQAVRLGAKGLDQYGLTGVPPPEKAAEVVLLGDKNPKPENVMAVKQSVLKYGPDYAKAFSEALDANIAKLAADKSKKSTSNSIGDAPGLFGITLGPGIYKDNAAEVEANRKLRAAAGANDKGIMGRGSY